MEEHQGVEGQDEKEEQHQPGVRVYKKRDNRSWWKEFCMVLDTPYYGYLVWMTNKKT